MDAGDKLMQLSEHEIQAAAFEAIWIKAKKDWRYNLIYAIPNGGYRVPGTARKLKSEGVKAGVWDISVDVPCGEFPGLKIEVKAGSNKLTLRQFEMLRYYMKAGYACAICRSTEEILSVISDYFNKGTYDRFLCDK